MGVIEPFFRLMVGHLYMKRIISCLVLGFLSVSASFAEQVSPADVISRARATVGVEQKLNGIVTLKLLGSLEPTDPKVPAATVLIIARKPSSQRLEIRVDDLVETTILNSKKACIIRSKLDAEGSQMRELTGPELERVHYSTKQFFNYYRPDFKNGEKVTYEGIVTHRDERTHKIKYSYPEGLETIRYFSVKDDTLVATISENGVESVSQGEQIVKGIKFPEFIDYYEDGRKLHTIRLAEVHVNEPLEAGIFRIPKASKK